LCNSHDNYGFSEKYQRFDQLSQFDQLNQHHKDVNLVGQTVEIGHQLVTRSIPPPTREAFGTALFTHHVNHMPY